MVAEAATVFSAVGTDYRQLLNQIVRLMVTLVGNGCMLTLIAPDGETLVNEANAHMNPDLEHDYRTYLSSFGVSKISGAAMSAIVARTGAPKLIERTEPDILAAHLDEAIKPVALRLNVHSYLVVPIRANGLVIGTLSLVRSRPGLGYTEDDLDLLTALANKAGPAIAKARRNQETGR